MKVGDLVRMSLPGLQPGRTGIVVMTKYRWPDPREEELSAIVLYPDTGEELEWSEYDLEVLG